MRFHDISKYFYIINCRKTFLLGMKDLFINAESMWCTRHMENKSLLNCVPCVLKTCSRANVPCVLTCSRANVPCVLTCTRANVPYVLTCQCVLRAYVLTCQRALRVNWQLALRAHVQKVWTGLFFWSKINILPCLVLEWEKPID